ncbi:hypothetical protein SAMN05443246_4746 [Paenibacillus sp. GP183]|nr:hypothetical protein SAMN05443246_4746 [Paenibacillus sp. GP183]
MQLQGTQTAAKTTNFKHSITMIMGMWLIAGVFIDGFAHNHGAVESFFTPWHAILYSGYLACAVWILILILQNKTAGNHATWIEAVPDGYKLGAAGVIIFFIGGIGDMIWHSVLGIEKDIEALLSPTHLILLSGGLLILTSPYRALSKSEKDEAPTFSRLLPALTSVALTFAVMAFFLMYAWSFRNQLPGAHQEDSVGRSIVDFLITTMLLVVPIMVILRRWKLPFGTVTYFFIFESVLMGVLDGFSHFSSNIILLISGIAGDLLFRMIKDKNAGDWLYRGVFFLLPIFIWGLYFLDLQISNKLSWSPELWGGAIFLSALCSLGLSILASPITHDNGVKKV